MSKEKLAEKQREGKKKKRLKKEMYFRELGNLHLKLAKLQRYIVQEGLKVVVLFEGRDDAGKGGTIKRITEPLNPRVVRVVALGKPTERKKTQWYFQRYVAHLPAADRDARPTRRHRLPPPADGVAEVRAGLVLIVNGEWIIVNGE